MKASSMKRLSLSSLAVLAVLFVAVIILSNILLRGVRIDLTESRLFTLTEGTEQILKSIEEPINLHFYFSDTATVSRPQIRAYATRVTELLDEFKSVAGDRLRVQIIDPEPFTEAEDEAVAQGLRSAQLERNGDNVFMGIVGTNSVDGREVIPILDPTREQFLEYDLAKLVHSLNSDERPVIGLISALPVGRQFDPATRQMSQPWLIVQQLEQLYQIRTIELTATEIGEDVDLLLLIHPKLMSDETLFAVDQFVLGGGRMIALVDPHAEVEQPPQDPQNPQAALFAERSSSLGKLFSAWGIEFPSDKVVLDQQYGINVGLGNGRQPVRHIGILSLDDQAMSTDDVTLAKLSSINLALAGHLVPTAGSEHQFDPLLRSSSTAQLIDANQVRFLPNPESLLNTFESTGSEYVIGARISGLFSSAFPDGLLEANDDPQSEDEQADAQAVPTHIKVASQPAQIVVIADVDMASDRMWARAQQFFGQTLINAFASNGDFLINLVDNMSGSSDLISIRGRDSALRPFTRVNEIRQQADEDYRGTLEQLENELAETDRKLGELQAGRDDDNPLILTEEQREEIERFQNQRLDIRTKQREVQRELRRDIDRLGQRTKLINVFLMPAILTIVALLVAWIRARRKQEVTHG